jgi:hypothetical protein
MHSAAVVRQTAQNVRPHSRDSTARLLAEDHAVNVNVNHVAPNERSLMPRRREQTGGRAL